MTQSQLDFLAQITAQEFDIKAIGATDNPEENLADISEFIYMYESIPAEEYPIGELGCMAACYGLYMQCKLECGGVYPCIAGCDALLSNCLKNCQTQ